MSKEMWFREMERIYAEKLDQGLYDDKAYKLAALEALGAVTERLADMADMVRLRRKDEGK